ncbi:MAG: glycoside hydrolase family 28 protein [Aristaeellaceae bacterium]
MMYMDVNHFGAIADGHTLNTEAIQRAIDQCSAAGGGTVFFPAGQYLTGSLLLKSHVTLYLDAGAVLLGSRELADYPLKHLIYARDAENIAITGQGCIDGQGYAFWETGHEISPNNAWRKGWGEVAHYYTKTLARPERMIRLAGCKDVKVEDVTLKNASSWTLHLLACEDVRVRGVTITNPLEGPNTDGIDIDGSRNVMISDCRIVTGDDAIVVKSTGIEGRKQSVRNVTVTNCILTTPCNAFKIGTETQADISNIVFSNSVVCSGGDWRYCDRAISGISIEMVDGAVLSQVLVSGITISNARSPLFIRLGNRGRGQEVPTSGSMHDIKVCNVQATGAILPCIVSGIEAAAMERVFLENIQMTFTGGEDAVVVPDVIPDLPADYPEAIMFGRWLPSYGMFCRHVKGLYLRGIDLFLEGNDPRQAVFMEAIQGLSASRITCNGELMAER